MNLLGFALTGLAVSGSARTLAGRRPSGRWGASVGAGVLGAILGGLLGEAVGLHGAETQLAGVIFSGVGAILLVAGYSAFARPRESV
jgi:uncharacterized membrane protein YeaQ/YmgE (transglycosylase-associated protein family)